MKTVSKKSAFGFSAVNAGQRNVAVEPQVIATSTMGQFRLTAPVSKALGIASGDYVTFITNVADIDAAIAKQTPEVVAFAEANGLELGSVELGIALHKEYDVWGIAKGYALYNSKGIALTIKERLTAKDKLAMVRADFDATMEAALASGNEELVAALTREGITVEEQEEILVANINGRELPKFQGSKCANPSGLTGAGLPVTFTDTNVWNQLKADVDAKEEMNRTFDVDLADVETITVNNGFEDVQVQVLWLGTSVDSKPVARTAKAEVEE